MSEMPKWPPDYVKRMDKHVLDHPSEQVFWDWAEIRGQLCDAWRKRSPIDVAIGELPAQGDE